MKAFRMDYLVRVVMWLFLCFGIGACMPHLQVAREPATRQGTFYYHIEDGYHYHRNVQRENTIYFKCVLYERGCRGRAMFDPIDGFVHTSPHIHDEDLLFPDEMALRNQVLLRCHRMDYASFRQILAQESRDFEPIVAARVTYSRMRTPMTNARRSHYPNLPRNLRGLTRILMDPAYHVLTITEDGNDNIYGGSVTDANGHHHILFTSTRMLNRMRSFRVLHSDGTFRSVPTGPHFAHQIFCIVGVWSHHIIPLAWVLMSSRTQVAYTSVLELIQHLMGPEIELTRVITDFEAAQQNAWQDVFGVAVQGCLWHLCRDYMDQVTDLRLLNRMRRIIQVRRIIRYTMALPLLPEDLIVQGYQVLLNEARNEGLYIFRIVHPFLVYVWRYWVSRPVRRARMSVFGSCQRTNNVCESHNRMLRQEVGVHGNLYDFIDGLVALEQRSHNAMLSLEEGRRVTRGRRRNAIMNDRRIQMLSDNLFNPPGPINQAIFLFLRTASHLMENIVDGVLFEGRRRNANDLPPN